MILHKFNQKGYDAYKKLIEDIQSSVEKENNDLSKGYTDELKQRVKDLQLDKSVQEKFVLASKGKNSKKKWMKMMK